jgi:hypothetical protein
MQKKVSKTNQVAARLAAPRASKAVTLVAAETKDKAASAKCIRPFAPSAVAPPKFLSPRVAIVRFIAAIASKNRAVLVNKT